MYAADTYYEETEFCELERIGEVLKGLPNSSTIFVRWADSRLFQNNEMMLMFIKYILDQDEKCLIYKLAMLQLKK